MRRSSLATLTGLEPATSAVTGRRANQLRHRALLFAVLFARERTLVDAMEITQIGRPRPRSLQVRVLFSGCSRPVCRARCPRPRTARRLQSARFHLAPSREDPLSAFAPVRWGETPSICPPAPHTRPVALPLGRLTHRVCSDRRHLRAWFGPFRTRKSIAGANAGAGAGADADVSERARPTHKPESPHPAKPYRDAVSLTSPWPARPHRPAGRPNSEMQKIPATTTVVTGTSRSRTPYGIRTRAAGVKGRCPRPLNEGGAATSGVTGPQRDSV